METALNQMKF